MMMVIIVEVLSFLPKKNPDGEDVCGEKRVRAVLRGNNVRRMMGEAKRATCKAGVLPREVAEGRYVVFG